MFRWLIRQRIGKEVSFRAQAIAAGACCSFALTEAGEVYAWGDNESGQLGVGDKENRLTPVKVPGLQRVKAIAAGALHSLALTEAGEVYAWGHLGFKYAEGRLVAIEEHPTPEIVEIVGSFGRVKTIAAGAGYSLALTDMGYVYAWGENRYGQLGLGDREDCFTPERVPGLFMVKDIAAGECHSLALTEDGTVYAWGDNRVGQLGLGDRETQNCLTPRIVGKLGGEKIKDIAAGNFHSLALTEAGEVYAWGLNEYGQLGLGDFRGDMAAARVLKYCFSPVKVKVR
jgi:alpha-tubulin suppressor-like RCC1 family protein